VKNGDNQMFDKKYAEEKCLWGLSPDSTLVENIGR